MTAVSPLVPDEYPSFLIRRFAVGRRIHEPILSPSRPYGVSRIFTSLLTRGVLER